MTAALANGRAERPVGSRYLASRTSAMTTADTAKRKPLNRAAQDTRLD